MHSTLKLGAGYCMSGLEKKLEFQLAIGTSISQILLALG